MLKEKIPPIKETVGAQYVCFSTLGANSEYTGIYEENVEKTEVVKSVKVSEENESSPIYGSGKIYQVNALNAGTEISVKVIAFPADTIAKMRADEVSEKGLIKSGGSAQKPFFAYGKVVKLSGGHYRYDWYPKCQLTANTDDTDTSEGKPKEQNDTLTIKAMPYDEQGHIKNSVDSSVKAIPGLTEDLFFSKPIITDADLDSILTSPSPANASGE